MKKDKTNLTNIFYHFTSKMNFVISYFKKIIITLITGAIKTAKSLFFYFQNNINYIKIKSFIVFVSVIVSSIVIIISTYVSIYNTATQRYKSQLGRLQFRMESLITQLPTISTNELALQISRIQSTIIPFEPDIKNPISIFKSFFIYYDSQEKNIFNETHNILKRIKHKLNDLSINEISFLPIPDSFKKLDYSLYSFKGFENSNFKNSSIYDSRLTALRLNFSNFSKTKINQTKMQSCRLTNCNFSNSHITEVIMDEAIVDFSDMSGATLWNNNLFLTSLINTDFNDSLINRNDFEYAILLGADLSKAKISELNNFSNALYNSQELNYEQHQKHLIVFTNLLMKYFEDINLITAYKIIINKIASLDIIRTTKFPEGFNPADHGMLDVYYIIEFIQKYYPDKVDKNIKSYINSSNNLYNKIIDQEKSDKELLDKWVQKNKKSYNEFLERLKDINSLQKEH